MAKIKIDGGMLTVALESQGEMSWYLDVQTGEVIPISDCGDNEIELDELEENSDRYRYIEPIDSHEGFRIMEDFTDTLPDSEARTALEEALRRRKPFRNFKDALYDFPKVQDQWYEYHEKALMEMARDWLESEEIDAELSTDPVGPQE